MKSAKLYTVRNLNGQFVGTYYARSAREAIGRVLSDQAQYFSTFRGSIRMTAADLTATVEG